MTDDDRTDTNGSDRTDERTAAETRSADHIDDEPPATTVERVDTNLHAVDRMDNSVTVETAGWDDAEPQHDFPLEMDTVVGGRVTELSMQAAFLKLSEVDEDGQLQNSHRVDASSTLELDDGEYHLNVETPVSVSVRFDGPATVEPEEEAIKLSFPQPQTVSLGFVSWLRYPKRTITVPRTVEGLATGISQFSTALQTTESHRSSDANRYHPPKIEFDDTVDIPETVSEHVPDTTLELRVPERLDVLFQVAPLAFYLGATVTVHDDGAPELRSTETDFSFTFGDPPRFQYEVAALLRRVFLLEAMIRNSQSVNANPKEVDELSTLDFDPGAYDGLSDLERLQTVLAVDFDAISAVLPEWHAVSYVEPTFENARVLPYLLRYLNVIFDPDTYPNGTDGAGPLDREFADVVPERVRRDTPHGSSIGWFGSNVPPDHRAFHAHPKAYENTRGYIDRDEGAGRIVVVCNDPDRTETFDHVISLYRTHTPETTSVDAYEQLDCAALASLFADGCEFLHFIGDGTDGFTCTDGDLALSDVETSNVRLFFVDATDSAATGMACIEAGSVGGFTVAGDRILQDDVRNGLVGLFSRGFTAEQAARYANAFFGSDDGGTVVSVGDGFQQLVRSMTLYCPVATVEPLAANEFALTVYPYIPEAGFVWRPSQDARSQFCAKPYDITVTGPELETLRDIENLVVVYDGEIHWDDTTDFFNPLV